MLVIKEAVIGEATTLKRITPKARGSAGPIRKRTSHIRIVLTDEVPIVRRSDRAKEKKKRAKNNKKEPAHLKKESPVPSAETQPELTSEATA